MIGLLVNDRGELLIQNGSLKLGDAKSQVVQHTLIADTGELKHDPQAGCNLRRTIAGTIDPFFVGTAKQQLSRQLIVVNSINLSKNNIQIDYE